MVMAELPTPTPDDLLAAEPAVARNWLARVAGLLPVALASATPRTDSGSPPPADDMLRMDQAAGFLGVSKSSMARLITSGTISSVPVGRRRLVRRQALLDFIADQERRGR